MLYSLNLSRSLHFLPKKNWYCVTRDDCSAPQNPICKLLKITLTKTCKQNERLSYVLVRLSFSKFWLRVRNQPENGVCAWQIRILFVFRNQSFLLVFQAGQISLNFVPRYSTRTRIICSHPSYDFFRFSALLSTCLRSIIKQLKLSNFKSPQVAGTS